MQENKVHWAKCSILGMKIVQCVLFVLHQTIDFWNLGTWPLLVSTHFQFPFFLSPGNLQDGVSLSQVQIGGRLAYFYKILQFFSVFFNNFQYCSVFSSIFEKRRGLSQVQIGGRLAPFYKKRCQGKDCEALCFNLHNIIFTKNNGNFTKSSLYAQEGKVSIFF